MQQNRFSGKKSYWAFYLKNSEVEPLFRLMKETGEESQSRMMAKILSELKIPEKKEGDDDDEP